MRRQIRVSSSHSLVLSSEILFFATDLERRREFRDRLFQLGHDISIVAYIRQPSAYYLSSIQQQLKSSSTFQAPSAFGFRERIAFFETIFERQVETIPYDRTSLLNGDIADDFIQRYFPSVVLPELEPEHTGVNESVSAESMALLQEYRGINHPDADYEIFREGQRFRMLLQQIESHYGLHARPRLREGIASFIDQATVDLLWLRDTRGIIFQGINYDNIGAITDNPYRNCQMVSDICEVDDRRKQEILMRAIKEGMTSRGRMPARLEQWLRRRTGNRNLRAIRNALYAVKRRLPI